MNLTQKDPNRENLVEMPPAAHRSPAPVCPHCAQDPCVMGAHILSVGGGIPVAVFVCTGCRKVIGTSIIPPMPEPPQRQDSRLVIP